MDFLKKYTSLFAATILFIVALIAVYPYYQYCIDTDATAYLTIAKRYAAGDFEKAINGYWSPWSIWLTALLMKQDIAPFLSAIIINAIGALGFLFISHSFFVRFKLKESYRWVLMLTLSLFLVYAVFKQSFDDLWECFFLLAALRIIIKDGFTTRAVLWVAAGALGAFAYFAKAYSFPFFVLNIICCSYFLTREDNTLSRYQWLKISSVSLLVMFALSFPWINLLHQEYGIWTTGTAGSLNLSWYLVGHPFWKENIVHLLPPVYADSPSYWEDPFIANGGTPHFWNSPKLLALQIVRVFYNILKWLQSMNELSAFFLFTWCIMLAIVFSKRIRKFFDDKLFIVALSFFLFPLGYLLINFEARYLWYMLPLSMLIGTYLLQKLNVGLIFFNWLFIIVFAFSFLAFPILDMKSMYLAGRKEFQISRILKKEKIEGSFTSIIPYGKQTQSIVRLAYFSNNPYYQLPRPATYSELLKEMRRYKVKYYFHFHDGDGENYQLKDEHGNAFQAIATGKNKGLKVFKIN